MFNSSSEAELQSLLLPEHYSLSLDTAFRLINFVIANPHVFLILAGVIFVLFWIWRRSFLERQRHRMVEKFGISGHVVYADSGLRSRRFYSRKYKIVAKPDFVVRLDTGEYAIVEYKSRRSGRVMASDVSQVKASVIAVRSKYPITKAYVLVDKKLHALDVDKSSANLAKEIATELKYARDAKRGVKIMVFARNKGDCFNCPYKSRCPKGNG